MSISVFLLHLLRPALPYLLLLTTSADHVWAHGGGGDIALFSTAGQVDIGFAILDENDEEQVFFDPNECVFLSVLLPQNPTQFIPWEFGSPEPGFDADEGTLPSTAAITVNLLELTYWDGAGAVNLTPGPAGVSAGVAPQPMQSFPDGGFHSHPLFGVVDPVGTPPNGVYVGKQTISIAGLTDSDPYYMVSLLSDQVTSIVDQEEQVLAAETIGELVRLYIEDPINNPAPVYEGVDYTFYADAVSHVRAQCIPEPSSVALAAISVIGVVALRRRRIDG